MDDEKALRELNAQISEEENQGNRDWLASKLAPKFAFQRADEARTVDDKDAFLQKVESGGKRETVSVGPIELFGNRAIVQCIVKVGDKHFHNLRLFVRRDGDWKLLGWANEPDAPARSHVFDPDKPAAG